MRRAFWLDPEQQAKILRGPLQAEGVDVEAVRSADELLKAAPAEGGAAALVLAEWQGAGAAIRQITSARPDIALVVASLAGAPPALLAALDQASGCVLDLRQRDYPKLARQVTDAIKRSARTQQELTLLKRMRELNEAFLDKMRELEQAYVDLEGELDAERDRLAAAERAGATNIMVVDDEPTICEMLRMLLEPKGYEVVAAADGEEALEIFRGVSVQLAIVDKNLPGIDGIEVLRHIRYERPEVDVMIITGYASKESAIEALRLGACAYLEKPFDDLDRVAADIEEVLERQRRRTKKSSYLQEFKARNQEFFTSYEQVRTELETWLYLAGG